MNPSLLELLPLDAHSNIAPLLPISSVGSLQRCSKSLYDIYTNNHIWMSVYLRSSGLCYEDMLRGSGFSLPHNLSWKETFQNRQKSLKAIRSVKVNGYRYVNDIILNCHRGSDALVLEDDEYIVSINVLQGDILDGIEFFTSKARFYRGGGHGGSFMHLSGVCLVGFKSPEIDYFGHRVRHYFEPIWYQDPLQNYLHPKKVSTWTVQFSIEGIHFLSVTFNDGTISSGGCWNLKASQKVQDVLEETVVLKETEKVVRLEIQKSTWMVHRLVFHTSNNTLIRQYSYPPSSKIMNTSHQDRIESSGASLTGLAILGTGMSVGVQHVLPTWSD
eukprot:TRINITY_DN27377_c0_g1_i1.p1 TRINITY_DN27377_c0_g1~~TRINITY_DN27377_c0_g1_i1.p1  ORF type:complete len:330 (-),score=48.33 TRINITY_DN27377_c0_g1_i1:114-1103(-)